MERAGQDRSPLPTGGGIAGHVGNIKRTEQAGASGRSLPSAAGTPILPGMFVVTEGDAAAIRAVYEQRGEFSAAGP